MNRGVAYLNTPKKIDLKVADVMKRNPIVVDPNAPLKQLADMMVKKGMREAIVVDGGKIRGIVTDGELLRFFTRHDDLEKTLVRDVILSPAITVTATMDILTAMKIMRSKGVKRLVVINDDDKIIGVINGDDLIEIVPSIIEYLI